VAQPALIAAEATANALLLRTGRNEIGSGNDHAAGIAQLEGKVKQIAASKPKGKEK